MVCGVLPEGSDTGVHYGDVPVGDGNDVRQVHFIRVVTADRAYHFPAADCFHRHFRGEERNREVRKDHDAAAVRADHRHCCPCGYSSGSRGGPEISFPAGFLEDRCVRLRSRSRAGVFLPVARGGYYSDLRFLCEEG